MAAALSILANLATLGAVTFLKDVIGGVMKVSIKNIVNLFGFMTGTNLGYS